MKRQPDPYTSSTTLGIDVSRWQGDINWPLVATDLRVKFAISRVGDGRDEDPKFKDNWKGSGAAGFVRGAYHYFRADRDGKFQADLVLDAIDEAGGLLAGDLPPILDIEGGANKNLPGGLVGGTKDLPIELVAEEALEFLGYIGQQLGVVPLVYAGQAFHWWFSQANPALADEFGEYPLWTPDYREVPRVPADKEGNPFPWKRWTIWQYTSKGSISGISTPVDLNVFRGDAELFKQFVSALRTRKTLDPKDAIRAEMRSLIEQLAQLQQQLDE